MEKFIAGTKVKKAHLFFCVISCFMSFGQARFSTDKRVNFMPASLYITYEYAHRNTLQTGGEFCINQKYDDKLFFGLGYGIGIDSGKAFGFPTAHLSWNTKKGYLYKFGFTNSKITAATGVSFLNGLDFHLGYSFPFEKEQLPQMKGVTFGVTVRLSNNKSVYLRMKMF